MADQGKPYSVSGEIMAGTPAEQTQTARDRRAPEGEILDAEYETVSAAGAIAGQSPAPTTIGSAAAPLAGMDMLRRADVLAVRAKVARGGPLFWVVGVGLAAAAFWVSGGHALVRNAPLFAKQASVRALGITGVTSRVDASGARPVLLVDGEAANDGSAAEPLPPLEIVVTGHDGRITRYRLGTSGRPLAPGERFAFSSRLDVPKNGVKTVSVTFGE
jgi:hypothetical protein